MKKTALLLLLMCLPVVTQAALQPLVPETKVVLPNSDTLYTSLQIDDETGILYYVQEVHGVGFAPSWKLSTQIAPDANNDDVPEVVAQYIAPKLLNPYDVNQDGVVNGKDFWTIFIFLYWKP